MAGVYIVTCRMRNEYNEYWGDKRRENKNLVALPGLEPGLFALRGRRVNQLHHNAKRIFRRRTFSPAHLQSIASSCRELKAAKLTVMSQFAFMCSEASVHIHYRTGGFLDCFLSDLNQRNLRNPTLGRNTIVRVVTSIYC